MRNYFNCKYFFFDRAQLKIDVPVNSLKNIQNLIYESALPKISFQSERENVMIGGDKYLIISSHIIYNSRISCKFACECVNIKDIDLLYCRPYQLNLSLFAPGDAP